MARPRTQFRNRVEYLAVRGVVLFARLLPRRAVPAVSRALGAILASVVGGRRRVVRANAELAYRGAADAPDPDRLARASLSNLCRSFLELFLLPPADRADEFRAMIAFREGWTLEKLRERFGPGPFVYAGSHFGAYEIMGACGGLFGEPQTSLMRPLDNPLLDRFLNAIRMRFGQRLAGNRGGLAELLRDLESGRSVAILVDLNMPKRGAVYPEFFGVKAATAKTAALLAYKIGRPLVPVFGHRTTEPFKFEIEIGEPIVPDPAADREAEIVRLMAEATAAVEARVRRTPEQWLWTHRRWKTRPPEETGA